MSKCAHLGLKNDPVTLLDFPSEGNYCHHAQPAAPPNYAHQEAYCLSEEHIYCPVFLLAERKPLPGGVIFRDHRRYSASLRNFRWIWLAILLILLVALMAIIVVFRPMLSSPGMLPEATVLATSAQVLQLGETRSPVTTTPPASATPAELQPSPTATRELSEAACTPPGGWTPYTILPTDSLLQLSLAVGMSERELRSLNCLEDDLVLNAGDEIFLPSLLTDTPESAVLTPVPTGTREAGLILSPNPTPTATTRPVRTSSPVDTPTLAMPTARPAQPSPTRQPTSTVVIQPPSPTSAPPPATPTSPPPPTP